MSDLINMLVTGDVVIYDNLFCQEGGKELTACHNDGGAFLLGEILRQMPRTGEGTGFQVSLPSMAQPAILFHSVWTPYPKNAKDSKEKVWRISQHLGYRKSLPIQPNPRESEISINGARAIIVIDDRNCGFRHNTNSHLWPRQLAAKDGKGIEWIIMRMSAPVAQGDLWRMLSTTFRERLIIVVNLDDLRKEEAGITHSLSWESTVIDLTNEVISNGMLSGLLKCRHLIVEIGSEGALWFDQSDKARKITLFFDPSCLEGEWRGKIPGDVHGEELCLTAGIAVSVRKELGSPDIGAGITSGLSASRILHVDGYGSAAKAQPSFPLASVREVLTAAAGGYEAVTVPEDALLLGKKWTIAQGKETIPQAPLYGLARRVALFGTRALGNIPFARFGKLFTIDRGEIESLRGMQGLMLSYAENNKPARPLCIAVFGAPGSGKSFGIKQIAKGIFGDKVPILEFNLSQFSRPEDLISAYHQVRDRVLEGEVPIVFWDEFDSQEYKWLQYLLAPMQDGKFQEGQVSHPIGKCVFIFAGGTSYTMENFAPPIEDIEKTKNFKLLKGPDFISRLNGYLNVLGPNPRQVYDESSKSWRKDETNPDLCFPVRRALLIRSVLGLSDTAECAIDRGLLTAFLEIDHYRHGARSLETVIHLCKKQGASQLMRSHIPPMEQLSLHLDYNSFTQLVRRDLPYHTNAEQLAPYVHKFYLDTCHQNGWTVQYDIEFEQLPPEIQADNVAAATRIPDILSHLGLRIEASPAQALSFEKVKNDIELQIEHLAAREHDGWMEQKIRSGWQYGPVRDDAMKTHPAMIPYSSLDDEDREKDRNAVRSYPEIIKMAGYGIVRCG